MILFKNYIANLVYYGKTSVLKIYHGAELVYRAILGCFTEGYWINTNSWTNDEGWKN